MIENIHRIREEARSRISIAPDTHELERLRVHYLGKKGLLTGLLHSLKDLSPDTRREMGAVLNEVKTDFESILTKRQGELDHQQVE